MPYFVHEKCECCRKWDWFLLVNDGEYVCKECKQKKKELEMEALRKASQIET